MLGKRWQISSGKKEGVGEKKRGSGQIIERKQGGEKELQGMVRTFGG